MIPPRLPTLEELGALLEKLSTHPGSIMVICCESFRTRNDCRVTAAWLSESERKVVRSALERVRKRRQAPSVS